MEPVLPGESVHVARCRLDWLLELVLSAPFPAYFCCALCILTPARIPCISVPLTTSSPLIKTERVWWSLTFTLSCWSIGCLTFPVTALCGRDSCPRSPSFVLSSHYLSLRSSLFAHVNCDPFHCPLRLSEVSLTTSDKSNVSLASTEWWCIWTLSSTLWPSEMHSCAFCILTHWRCTKETCHWYTVPLLIEVLLYCVSILNLNVWLPGIVS